MGITDPLPPGLSYDDWLYTGRAFAFNSDAVVATLVALVREDIAGQTYWRVFVRTANQDGSQGEPLLTVAKLPEEFFHFLSPPSVFFPLLNFLLHLKFIIVQPSVNASLVIL